LVAVLAGLMPIVPVLAAEDHQHHQHHPHQHAAATQEATRSSAEYRLGSVKLVRADGARIEFPADIDDGRPVFVNFIYTTCTAICPVMTQIFSAFEKKLGTEASRVRLVSISIDPEQDTPKRLAAYARQYSAGPDWSFYTGTVSASVAVQKAFAAYRGDKMNHTPLTLIRPAPGKPWVRLDGFATPDDLMREYRLIAGAK
jgi:protein SCO1/2